MICPACDGNLNLYVGRYCMFCDNKGVVCDTCRKPPDECECADGEEGEIEDMMGIEEIDE